MADVFPTALESHHSPTTSGSTDQPSVNGTSALKLFARALESLQAKVGINSSNVATSLDYRVATLEAAPPGQGAPTNAEYVVAVALAGLSAERVTTDTATISWDHSQSGKAKANVVAASVTDAEIAAANKDGTAGTPSMRTLGTSATQACAGNDSRLSDTRVASGAYAPGSFSVATGNYRMHVARLTLTGAQRATIAGTGRLRIT